MSEEDSLAVNVKSYEEARREEFHVAATGTSDEVAQTALANIASLLPEATSALNQILRNGDKDDAVRMQAIKVVFEYTLGKPTNKSTKDSDIEKIIESLRS